MMIILNIFIANLDTIVGFCFPPVFFPEGNVKTCVGPFLIPQWSSSQPCHPRGRVVDKHALQTTTLCASWQLSLGGDDNGFQMMIVAFSTNCGSSSEMSLQPLASSRPLPNCTTPHFVPNIHPTLYQMFPHLTPQLGGYLSPLQSASCVPENQHSIAFHSTVNWGLIFAFYLLPLLPFLF